MEFYKLDQNFIRTDLIDEFNSAVWTERYSKTGDVTLVVPPSVENRLLLPEGTFLQVNDSDEVALIDSALIEDGNLKLTGNMVTAFLNERLVRSSPLHKDKSLNLDVNSPEEGLVKVVKNFVVAGGAWTNFQQPAGFDGSKQVIPNLSVAELPPLFPPGTRHILSLPPGATQLQVPFGPLYDAIAQIAETYQLGFKIYLDHANESGYSLVFKTWIGKDRTSQQSTNKVVRFSPAMDSLTNLKELHSISGYKTVAYAYATTDPNNLASAAGYAEAYPGAGNETGFARRNLMVFVDDIPDDITDYNTFTYILDQRAKDALANNNYTKVVDGEVVPQSEFQYGRDYGLGDVIELKGVSDVLQEARITEYIRTQDNTGERAYPTVSVLS